MFSQRQQQYVALVKDQIKALMVAQAKHYLFGGAIGLPIVLALSFAYLS
jgi:hypothetical protein